ncbi:MAG: polysaccharide export protein [Verrucomicrobiales bacterium]|nr:polysaccharide export protein [Verrucomicrobiales bacterium]
MQANKAPSLSVPFGLFLIFLCGAIQLRAENAEDRRIEPSDLIIVAVFDELKLSGEYRVQAGGTIRYPLLGTVEVAGKTPTEVADELNKKLGEDYLVNPEVTVLVKQYRSRTVTVMGKVMKPGPVLLPEEEKMDIIQALAQAGGFQPTANLNKIRFSRGGKMTTYKFRDLKKIADDTKKIWLEPGDVIEVEESVF